MLRMWEQNTGAGETLEGFTARVNEDLDKIRAAGLKANYGVLPNGGIFAQVGREETIRHPQTGQSIGTSFIDLSVADVDRAIDAAKRLAASRPGTGPRMLGPN